MHHPFKDTLRSFRAPVRTIVPLLGLFHLVVLGSFGIAGCASSNDSRPSGAMIAEGETVFADLNTPPGSQTGAGRSGIPTSGWTIVLFKPDLARAPADQWLASVQQDSGLSGAFLLPRDGELFVAVGTYNDPAARRTQRDFERIRTLRVGNARPYANARILPISTGAAGSNPTYDLRNVQAERGLAAKFTLQVGLYRKEDGRTPSPRELADIRQAAEEAVDDLRAQGEEAFYWHTAFASLVTIGVFGETDLDTDLNPPAEGPRIRELRDRHPNNLINGLGALRRGRTIDGRAYERLEPSVLVEIPRD
ncbi:MAG: hypothetical protein AAF235_02265 [Planctomycetota bacterium]